MIPEPELPGTVVASTPTAAGGVFVQIDPDLASDRRGPWLRAGDEESWTWDELVRYYPDVTVIYEPPDPDIGGPSPHYLT